jgi:hypothetical protein
MTMNANEIGQALFVAGKPELRAYKTVLVVGHQKSVNSATKSPSTADRWCDHRSGREPR